MSEGRLIANNGTPVAAAAESLRPPVPTSGIGSGMSGASAHGGQEVSRSTGSTGSADTSEPLGSGGSMEEELKTSDDDEDGVPEVFKPLMVVEARLDLENLDLMETCELRLLTRVPPRPPTWSKFGEEPGTNLEDCPSALGTRQETDTLVGGWPGACPAPPTAS